MFCRWVGRIQDIWNGCVVYGSGDTSDGFCFMFLILDNFSLVVIFSINLVLLRRKVGFDV